MISDVPLALQRFSNICACRKFSEDRIAQLSKELEQLCGKDASVVVNGSFARLEASAESDIDFFILTKKRSTRDSEKLAKAVREQISKVVGKPPAKGGAFGAIVTTGELAKIIGGNDDSNPEITRRILFLTEGRALTGGKLFEEEQLSLLQSYVKDTISDHQLGLFLLNDIIRYYRTVCVDFENKTVQNGKTWGDRNIKLVFSRKMLYFGGVLICAEMAQKSPAAKRATATRLMGMTPIERCLEICDASILRALKEYDHFLGEMAKPDVRELLKSTPEDRKKHSETFKNLKNRGHQFSMALMSAMSATYPPSHPIHRALVL
jgi:predicted nucleotidyltransferase